MTDNEQIEEIISYFDFYTVHRVMKFLKWKMAPDDEIPSIGKLVLNAQKMLKECFQSCRKYHHDNYSLFAGPFCVEVFKTEDGDYKANLKCVITEFSTQD